MAGEKHVSVLDIKDDLKAAASIKRALADIRREIKQTGLEFEAGNRTADDVVAAQKRVADAVNLVGSSYKAGALSASDYADAIADAAKAQAKIRAGAPGSSGSGTRQQSTGEVFDRVGSFGSQFFGGLGQGEIGNVFGLVGDFASAIGTVNPVAIAATTTLGTLTLGISAMQNVANEASDVIRRRLAVERELYSFVQTATTQEVKQRIDALQNELEFEQRQYERIAAERDKFAKEASPSIGSLLSGFGLVSQLTIVRSAADEYNNALKDSSQRQAEVEQTLEGLNTALQDGTLAANDAAAAEKELAQQRRSQLEQDLSDIADFTRLQQQLRDASSTEAVGKMIAAEQDRLAILEAQRTHLENFNDGSEQMAERIATLNDEIETANLNIGDMNRRFVGLIPAGFGNILSGASKGIAALRDELADIRASSAAALERTIRPILDSIDKLNLESARKEIEFISKRADIEADFTKQALRDAANFARQRIKIERDAASSMFSAVARRDAVAFDEARKRRADQLDELKEDAAAQSKIRDEDRREKLQALEREIADFRQSNAQKRAELQRQYQYEIAAERARLTTAQSAAVARATIEQAGANTVLGIARNFWINMINQAQAAANAAAARSAATPPLAGAVVNSESVARQIAIAMRRNGG